MALALDDALEGVDFSAASFDLPIPAVDGRKAAKLTFRLSGTADLDRTSEDDLAFLEAARMGREIRVIATGWISAKGFALAKRERDDGELGYWCNLKVTSIEAGELA